MHMCKNAIAFQGAYFIECLTLSQYSWRWYDNDHPQHRTHVHNSMFWLQFKHYFTHPININIVMYITYYHMTIRFIATGCIRPIPSLSTLFFFFYLSTQLKFVEYLFVALRVSLHEICLIWLCSCTIYYRIRIGDS